MALEQLAILPSVYLPSLNRDRPFPIEQSTIGKGGRVGREGVGRGEKEEERRFARGRELKWGDAFTFVQWLCELGWVREEVSLLGPDQPG